jgi:hypothetical protein
MSTTSWFLTGSLSFVDKLWNWVHETQPDSHPAFGPRSDLRMNSPWNSVLKASFRSSRKTSMTLVCGCLSWAD